MTYLDLRKELISYLEGLSDRSYQQSCWINDNCPCGTENDELDYAVHFLFDDTDLANDPLSLVGEILKNEREADVIQMLCKELSNIFDIHGYDLSDQEYLNCPEWDKILHAANLAKTLICFNTSIAET